MKWERGHESRDVIDERGRGGGPVGAGGLLPLALQVGSRFGFKGILVAGALVFAVQYFAGGSGGSAPDTSSIDDPSRRMGPRVSGPEGSGPAPQPDDAASFTGFVLDDVQQSWQKQFSALGKSYQNAKLVLFTDSTSTGCGYGQAAMGPFYCPVDHRVFIDLGFFSELERRFRAPGDFARAYVIAHELGHHVQTLLGLDQRKRQAGSHAQGADGASVRLELQADCLAGVWAHDANLRQLLDPGDVDEALAAASAVGDDRIQKAAGRAVTPETWTHGSAAERSKWFKRGFATGRLDDCDTSSGTL